MSSYVINNKVNCSNLCLEITRWCNLKCKHCNKGEMQNINMSKEIIDKTLDGVSAIDSLHLLGGEPFKCKNEIIYLIDELIRRMDKGGFICFSIHVVTNGTILDKDIAKAFNKYSDYMNNRFAQSNRLRVSQIGISDGSYHKNNVNKAYEFYSSHCNSDVFIEKHNYETSPLVYSGRAKENIAKDRCTEVNPLHKVEIELVQDTYYAIKCPIVITANGGFIIDVSNSYDVEDKYSIGNILNTPLLRLVNDWNNKHNISCYQCNMRK